MILVTFGVQGIVDSGASTTSIHYDAYKSIPQLYSLMMQIHAGESQQLVPPSLQAELPTLNTTMFLKNCTVMRGRGLCQFGDLHAKTSLVIMGDSFAMQWVPALAVLGSKFHFKVIGYMLEGCNIASAQVVSLALKRLEPACTFFRRAAISQVNQLSPAPALVLLAEARYRSWPNGRAVTNIQWDTAVASTLHKIHSTQKAVIFGAPEWSIAPGVCLSFHLAHATACALSTNKIVNSLGDGYNGIVAGGGYPMGVTLLMCGSSCPAIAGGTFIHADQWHMTAAYAAKTAQAFGALIGCGQYGGLSNLIVKVLGGSPSSGRKSTCTRYIKDRGWPS